MLQVMNTPIISLSSYQMHAFRVVMIALHARSRINETQFDAGSIFAYLQRLNSAKLYLYYEESYT